MNLKKRMYPLLRLSRKTQHQRLQSKSILKMVMGTKVLGSDLTLIRKLRNTRLKTFQIPKDMVGVSGLEMVRHYPLAMRMLPGIPMPGLIWPMKRSQNTSNAEIKIDVLYLDAGQDEFCVEFDAVQDGEDDFKSTELIKKTNSGELKTATFVLEDAYFGNRLSGQRFPDQRSGGWTGNFCQGDGPNIQR